MSSRNARWVRGGFTDCRAWRTRASVKARAAQIRLGPTDRSAGRSMCSPHLAIEVALARTIAVIGVPTRWRRRLLSQPHGSCVDPVRTRAHGRVDRCHQPESEGGGLRLHRRRSLDGLELCRDSRTPGWRNRGTRIRRHIRRRCRCRRLPPLADDYHHHRDHRRRNLHVEQHFTQDVIKVQAGIAIDRVGDWEQDIPGRGSGLAGSDRRGVAR